MSVDYLRVSVTNRCNLRCVYCHPLSDYGFIECEEILTFDEIHRIIRLFAECGIKKVRLTGGEPLVRKNIVQFVRKLAAINGIEELSATTNGVFLESLAAELKEAGLQRVNVSVDSIERESYERITGFDLLPRIAKGIYKAIEVGLTPVKINSVIIKGLNDSVEQITALAQLSVHLPVTVRFIEYCPTCKCTKPAGDYLPNEEVHSIIEREYGALSRVIMGCGNGPALYFKIRDSAGTIGFISGRSSIFCRSCNRLRLTSDGILMPCLYSSHTYDLKKLIRNQADDWEIRDLLNRIISEKGSYTRLNSHKKDFSMCGVGG